MGCVHGVNGQGLVAGGGGRWRGASRKQESAKSVWVEREGQVPKGASETQAGGVGENRGVTWFNFT